MASAGKKTVWIDIYHIPQFNFYNTFIHLLNRNGYRILVTVLDRGRLKQIAFKELQGLENVRLYVIGKHRMKRWSVILEANLIRLIWLFFWALFKHIDISFSNGFQHGFVAKFKRFPAYSFHDDPQAGDHHLMNVFCTKDHSLLYELPDGFVLDKKDELMPTLKEWAYLSPKYFIPNKSVLQEYGVVAKEYLFLREVSVGTFNYAEQKLGAIMSIAHLIPDNKKVLFSLEEKSRRDMYPKDWILLQEPINDIHSLIYYSSGLVSSGDSMAREAALLGVPSYYLGIRYTMPANYAASRIANLQNQETMPISEWLKCLDCPKEQQIANQEQLRAELYGKFVDVNEYMYGLVRQS